jgi:hypothetical protein
VRRATRASELIENDTQPGFGIGLAHVDDDPPTAWWAVAG